MKRSAALCVLLLTLLLLAPCARAEEGYTLLIATDLHYIAPALTDHGSLFTALTESADGKLMRYIEEITDAFFAEAAAQKPQALLLTGDLSFNGALLSHTALAAKLRALEGEGVRVLVLPGNHDLNNPNAAAYSGDGYTRVQSASSEDFRRIYADFGFNEALSLDADSLSYAAELRDGTRLLMLDFNTLHDPCGLSDVTLRWIEEQLRDARAAGRRVLAAGHQNLYQLTMFRGGYVVDGADRLAALFRKYGVELYLSGHLHCQHWRSEEGLTEIATSALSVSPCQYGFLTMEGERLRYAARKTDVAAWAASRGWTDAKLLDFPATAAAFFDRRNRENTAEALSLFQYTPEEVERMTEYIVRLNRAFFSGDLTEAAELDGNGEIAALFDRCPSLYTAYIHSVRPDFGTDFRVWRSD